jgi:hypothetical protein
MGYDAREQGLARSKLLNVRANPGTVGLGFGDGERSAALTADFSPAPDTAVLACGTALGGEEVVGWGAPSTTTVPAALSKSKMVPDDHILAELVSLRKVAESRRECPHDAHPCLAPTAGPHSSTAYWKLAALDAALTLSSSPADLTMTAAPELATQGGIVQALDLSLTGSGAAEYIATALGGDWCCWPLKAALGAAPREGRYDEEKVRCSNTLERLLTTEGRLRRNSFALVIGDLDGTLCHLP